MTGDPFGWADRVGATPRIFLRAPHPDDRQAFVAMVQASVDFLRPWEPLLGHADQETGAKRFQRLMALARRVDTQKFFVCRRSDGAVMGMMNCNNIVHGVFQNAALGYWMGAAYAKQGYATEALQIGLFHAFRTLKLHRVEANIKPDNTASIALVQRAGFRDEGFSPKFLKIAGAWADHRRFALLCDEWTPTYA